jgi:hypothetical protein
VGHGDVRRRDGAHAAQDAARALRRLHRRTGLLLLLQRGLLFSLSGFFFRVFFCEGGGGGLVRRGSVPAMLRREVGGARVGQRSGRLGAARALDKGCGVAGVTGCIASRCVSARPLPFKGLLKYDRAEREGLLSRQASTASRERMRRTRIASPGAATPSSSPPRQPPCPGRLGRRPLRVKVRAERRWYFFQRQLYGSSLC